MPLNAAWNAASVGTFSIAALKLASLEGHKDDVQHLLEMRGVWTTHADEHTGCALVLGSQNGHYEVVQLLLDHVADRNLSETEYGCSALALASQNGHLDVALLLLDRGAQLTQAMATKPLSPGDGSTVGVAMC